MSIILYVDTKNVRTDLESIKELSCISVKLVDLIGTGQPLSSVGHQILEGTPSCLHGILLLMNSDSLSMTYNIARANLEDNSFAIG